MTEELEGCIFTSEKNKEFVGVKRTRKDWFDVSFLLMKIAAMGFFPGLVFRSLLFNDDYSLKEFSGRHLFGILLILGIAFVIFVMAANAIGLLLVSRKRRIVIDYDTREVTVKTGFFTKRMTDFSEIRHLEYAVHTWEDSNFGYQRGYRVELQLVLWNRKKLPLLTLNNKFIFINHTSESELLKRGKIISKRIASSFRVRAVLGKKVRE